MPDRYAMHVLVVEDDADTRANLHDILQLDNFHVETAGSLAETFARRNWSDIDLVILDRRLPDGDAEEMLPQLKALAPEAAVIVATGFADLEGAIAALRYGAADYVLKPINADALRASLARIVERRRLADDLRKEQEKALQAERLAAIGQMMTGLTHESRNALQRSKACLEMLALEVEDRPEALKLVARIEKAQDHLQRLYEEVRSYAAPITLDREPCDLAPLWRENWSEVTQARPGKDVRLSELGSTDDLVCHIDRFAVGQVFRNILENALSAVPNPGEIVVRAKLSDLDGKPAIAVSFVDNGPGLGPEQRERIFEPFYTTKTKGTGLGMAIAKRIVESHGGTIEVGNRPSPGAQIVVTLPRGAS